MPDLKEVVDEIVAAIAFASAVVAAAAAVVVVAAAAGVVVAAAFVAVALDGDACTEVHHMDFGTMEGT